VNFDFSDEQDMLRDQARRFLTENSGFAQIRKFIDSKAQYDADLWREAMELGWLGVAVSEECGGLGLGPLELCVLNEELGRFLTPIPFFSTVCLAAELLKEAVCDSSRDVLRRIAAGEAIVAVATAEGAADWGWGALKTRFTGGLVTGAKQPVADLMAATDVIVTALDEHDQPIIGLVNGSHGSVRRRDLHGLDPLRRHGELLLRGTPGVELARGAQAQRILSRVLDQGAVFAAFEQIGGAEAALHLARDYTLQRYAFGRPLAGNQAVKHRLADMLAKIEMARSNAYFGAWSVESGSDTLPRAAAAARLSASDAFEFAAEECLHLHGGIGYTWDANCHFFYRRARLLSVSLRNTDWWGEQLLTALADG
jgi:acyl-CoA dehydrogenase